jgi:hypothetical protein
VVIAVIGFMAYTSYAQNYGYVKIEDGGYIKFDSPQNTYIVERSDSRLRLMNMLFDYTQVLSVSSIDCDINCRIADEDYSNPIYAVSNSLRPQDLQALGLNSLDNFPCANQKLDKNNFSITKPYAAACYKKIKDIHSYILTYQITPNKYATVNFLGSNDDDFKKSFAAVSELVNSSEYQEDIWPKFGFVRNYIIELEGAQ